MKVSEAMHKTCPLFTIAQREACQCQTTNCMFWTTHQVKERETTTETVSNPTALKKTPPEGEGWELYTGRRSKVEKIPNSGGLYSEGKVRVTMTWARWVPGDTGDCCLTIKGD